MENDLVEYENLPSRSDSESEFSSEHEEDEGEDLYGYEPPTPNFQSVTRRSTSNDAHPHSFPPLYDEQDQNTDFDQEGIYEPPSEQISISRYGRGSSAPTPPRPLFTQRGFAPVVPPTFGSQNLPIRTPSYPRPLQSNAQPRNIPPRGSSDFIRPLPMQRNPRPFHPRPLQIRPRFGPIRPGSFNAEPSRLPSQSSNIKPMSINQHQHDFRPIFRHSNIRQNIPAHVRHPKPTTGEAFSQSPLAVNTKFILPSSASPESQRFNTNVQNPRPPALPKHLLNAHLQKFPQQQPIQSLNVRPTHPWGNRQAPPLVKAFNSPQARHPFSQANWRGKTPNFQNHHKPPPPPNTSKPLNEENLSKQLEKQRNSPINASSINELESSMQSLQLNTGEKIPMTELYRSLLNEEYFHPISKESTSKYMTEGTFLLRPSKTHSDEKPLTLVLRYNGKTFIFSVEKRKSGLYSIGQEKDGEMAFSTIQELVSYYRENAFHFEGLKTYFLHPATKPSS